MSAPETKAWSPAPVTTTTRMAGSFSDSSMMIGIASHMSDEVALRWAGLLKTSRPTGPAFSAIMFGVGLIICLLLLPERGPPGPHHDPERTWRSALQLNHAALAEAGDGSGVVASLLQHR